MSPNVPKAPWGKAWWRGEDSSSPEAYISSSYKIHSLPVSSSCGSQDHMKASNKSNKKFSYAEKYPAFLIRAYLSDIPRILGRENKQ